MTQQTEFEVNFCYVREALIAKYFRNKFLFHVLFYVLLYINHHNRGFLEKKYRF